MTTTAGRRRAEPAKGRTRPLANLGVILGGIVLGALAWYFLVKAAIDFGGKGREGDALAWAFLGVASVGAIVCMVLVLVLVGRGRELLGLRRDSEVPASAGGRRRLVK